ncbi:hypothetical protein [Rhodopseudomonas sp. BR0G17]|uniref:hypothetical protein n=1 Tax=Rhodopseudomonas sp. BR0G17 TaxID=2269368 RepID=UPI0013DE9120|nr:hypothetical protein [Rhodopseudomonas sp. BR0G17]NEW96620.1 hypothetical protein [Rhodopseudomonas sp. BR0G17]
MRFYRGDAHSRQFRNFVDANDAAGFAARAAAHAEPTKRELREMIAQAVRNTAALQGRATSKCRGER